MEAVVLRLKQQQGGRCDTISVWRTQAWNSEGCCTQADNGQQRGTGLQQVNGYFKPTALHHMRSYEIAPCNHSQIVTW